MLVGFVFNEALDTVGYEMNIDVTRTFGYMIDLVCDVLLWQHHDFVFMLNGFTVVKRHWVPQEMGMKNTDRLKIYCVRRTSPLLLFQ